MNTSMIVLGIVVLVAVFIAVRCIRIVQQARAYVIEFLGAYKTTWNVGIHFKLPFVERILELMMSRLVRHWSSSRSPMMLRSVVAERFSIASMGCSMP